MTFFNSRAQLNHLPCLGALAAAGLFCAAVSLAADSAGMSAAQIVARNLTARGGENAWRKIEEIEFIGKMDAARPRPALEGTVDAPPAGPSSKRRPGLPTADKPAAKAPTPQAVQLPYRLELKRPHKSRLEIDVQGQTAVQVFNGQQGWKLRPFLGRSKPEPYTAEELKLAENEPQLDGYLINAAKNGTQTSLEGKDTVEGRSCYRLKLALKNGEVRHVWVDAGTYLETRVDGTRKFNGKARTTYTYYRDYRTVGDVRVPYLFEATIDGLRTTDKIIIDKVLINPGLPDSRFEMPAAAAAKTAAAMSEQR